MANPIQGFFQNLGTQAQALPDYLRLKANQAKPQPKMEFKVGEGVPQQPSPLKSIEQRITQARPKPVTDPITELARTTVEPILGPIVQKFSPHQGTFETPVGTIETPKLKIEKKIEEGKSPLRAQLEVGGEIGLGIASITPFGRAAKVVSKAGKTTTVVAKAAEKAFPFINLEKFSPEVREFLEQTAKEITPKIQQQRRGSIPQDVTVKLAAHLGMTPEKLARTPAGQAFNAEGLVAAGSVVERTAKNAVGLQKSIREGNNATENLINFHKAVLTHQASQAVFSGARAEAGRALGILKRVNTALQSKDQQLLDRTLEELGGRELTEEITKKLAQIDPNDTFAVNKFLRSLGQPKATDFLQELWYNSVLSGPPTHIINSISNTLFQALQIPTKVVRAGAEVPIAKLQGREREYFFSEVAPAVIGTTQGIKDGARKALYILKNGFTLEDATKVGREFGNISRREAFGSLPGPIGKVLGPAVNIPSRALVAADSFFKATAYSSELYGSAARIAAKEGAKGKVFSTRVAELINNPSTDMLKDAGKFADYVTFTTEPGKTTRAFLNLRNKVPAARFIVPFVNTPMNLVKAGAEFSPLGFGNAARVPGAQKSDALAKALVGSFIESAIAIYAWDGKITGAPPQNSAERDKFFREGKQPYSLKIGDTWVSYQRIEPFQQTLAAVAALHTAFVDNKEAPSGETIAQIAASIGQNVVSATWLQGVSSLIDAIEDPERSGERFLQNLATGFVPYSSMFRTLDRMVDPYIRKPEGIPEAVKANIPGLSKDVLPRRTVFGEAVKRQGGPLAQLSPIRTSKEVSDPTEKELERLNVSVGFIDKKVSGIQLDNREYNLMLKASGKLTKVSLDKMIADPGFQSLKDVDKEKHIRNLITDVRLQTRDLLMPVLVAKRLGLDPEKIDPQVLKDVLSGLSKVEDFKSLSAEKQNKVILKFLEQAGQGK